MSDPEISELGKVKIRVGILKGMHSGTVITADALQQTINSFGKVECAASNLNRRL